MESTKEEIGNKEAASSYLLEVDNLSKAFRGLLAVDGYQIKLPQGEIRGIIGPNGAGKTTVFNLITGFLRPTSGIIRFAGREITYLPPDEIARMGIGRTFQNVRLFSSMTVLDNVKTALQLHSPDNFLTTIFSWPSFLKREQQLTERSLELLALFNLAERADMPATSLPYGDQRRLEIIRALALRPKLLLLDEPVAGLNPSESQTVLEFIREVRDLYDLTIIVVEHNMPVVMKLCERIQVLNYGKIIAEGTPEEIRNNPLVIEAYLGKEEANPSETAYAHT
jgi:branched-chain amino acid transport system ATP-binding protein